MFSVSSILFSDSSNSEAAQAAEITAHRVAADV
jgi:hypothetical protein